jgi:hypothetical protein
MRKQAHTHTDAQTVTHALDCAGGEGAEGEIEERDEKLAKENQGKEDATNVFKGAVHTRMGPARA